MQSKKNNKFLLYFLPFMGIVLPVGYWLLEQFPDFFAKIAAWGGLILIVFIAIGLAKLFDRPHSRGWRGPWGL